MLVRVNEIKTIQFIETWNTALIFVDLFVRLRYFIICLANIWRKHTVYEFLYPFQVYCVFSLSLSQFFSFSHSLIQQGRKKMVCLCIQVPIFHFVLPFVFCQSIFFFFSFEYIFFPLCTSYPKNVHVKECFVGIYGKVQQCI